MSVPPVRGFFFYKANPMDTQDRQKSGDGKIWERWIEIADGIYAKYVSIRGDISDADPLPVKLEGTEINAVVQVDTDELESRIGAKTEAAVVTDANGSIHQYLRGLVSLIVSKIQVILAAGENHVGEVGGRGIIVSDEFVRPADTTQYATNDVVGVNFAVVGVTSGPGGLCKVEVAAGIIDVTIKDGDFVTIASIVGTTEANGDNYATKFDATHFTIPVAFINAYTSGGTIARMPQMEIARVNGGSGFINALKLSTNNTTVTNAVFDCYAYETPLSAILDNAQQMVLYANAGKGIFLGTIVMVAGGTGSDGLHGYIANINLLFKCAANSKRIYLRYVNPTATGYIPASGQKFTSSIRVSQD